MKDKLTIFIIGLLLGSIISTASIYFYTVANDSNNNSKNEERMEISNGNPPSMPNGGFGGNGTPPEFPYGNDNQNGA